MNDTQLAFQVTFIGVKKSPIVVGLNMQISFYGL